MISKILADGITPFKYQKEGADFALLHHYCLIGDEMGLGKTLQALLVAFITGKKCLVVCPAFLRLNWYLEIEKFSRFFHYIFMAEAKKELPQFDPRADFAIISYSMVKESEHLFEWAEMVVADEAHKLKDLETGWTQLFHQYVYENMPERLMLLTGTPIPNGVVEFYSLLRLLGYSPKRSNGLNVFEDYEIPYAFYKDFANEVEIRVGRSTYTRWEGLKNKALLKKYLAQKYIRRRCNDVLDLPPLIDADPIVVAYGSDPTLLREFELFNAEEKYTPQRKAKSALLKAPFTVQVAENIVESKQGPVLVYTDHVEACEFMANELGCPFIHGSVPVKKRNEYVKLFQEYKLNYLVITIGAGGEGMNLTAATNLIFNDLSWIPAKNEQVRKRFHRIGQTKRCTVHTIVGSIQDKKIIKSLWKKMKVIREII